MCPFGSAKAWPWRQSKQAATDQFRSRPFPWMQPGSQICFMNIACADFCEPKHWIQIRTGIWQINHFCLLLSRSKTGSISQEDLFYLAKFGESRLRCYQRYEFQSQIQGYCMLQLRRSIATSGEAYICDWQAPCSECFLLSYVRAFEVITGPSIPVIGYKVGLVINKICCGLKIDVSNMCCSKSQG